MSPAKHVDPTTGRRIRQPYRENMAFAAAAVRFTKALGKRASNDVDVLPELVAIRETLDAEIQAAVDRLRSGDRPHSWTDIGSRLGISKQAAQQRYGHSSSTVQRQPSVDAAADTRGDETWSGSVTAA